VDRIRDVILEVEATGSITTIANLKKLKAEGIYYRIGPAITGSA
jgi:hypothetical protein